MSKIWCISTFLNSFEDSHKFEIKQEFGETLYNKLKELRFEYAKKLNLPAYVIFPDKT